MAHDAAFRPSGEIVVHATSTSSRNILKIWFDAKSLLSQWHIKYIEFVTPNTPLNMLRRTYFVDKQCKNTRTARENRSDPYIYIYSVWRSENVVTARQCARIVHCFWHKTIATPHSEVPNVARALRELWIASAPYIQRGSFCHCVLSVIRSLWGFVVAP